MVNKRTVWSVASIALRLLAICLVVAALTALVYAITVEPIAKGERARKENAIRAIFADAGSYTETDMTGDGINAVYRISDAKAQHMGWCVDYTGNSDYGGAVNMMIGVGLDGKVTGVQVISHAETFIDRYLDDKGSYTGADVSAGATLSYNAIRDAIRAVEGYFAPLADASLPSKKAFTAELADVQLLFADAADFSEQETVDLASASGWINAVRVVKDGNGAVLGRCVYYSSAEAFTGEMELLLAVSPAGKVTNVLVLESSDDRLPQYLDSENRYTGVNAVRDVDAKTGATRSYDAIRNAMEAVEAVKLGGAA